MRQTLFKKSLTLFLLIALLLSLFPTSTFAGNEPQQENLKDVGFYYASRAGQPGLITDDQFYLYDEDGEEPIAPAEGGEHKEIAKQSGTYSIRTVKYKLAPGIYRWEGYIGSNKANFAGEGYFEVSESAEGEQRFNLARCQVTLSSTSTMGSGCSQIELEDYLGNTLKPNSETYYTTGDSSSGLKGRGYLVIMREIPDTYDPEFDDTDDPEYELKHSTGQAYRYIYKPLNQDFSVGTGLLYWASTNFASEAKIRQAMTASLSYALDPSMVVDLSISVTKGEDCRVYQKTGNNYRPLLEYPSVGKDTSGEAYDVYKFEVPQNVDLRYEAGGGEYLREAQTFHVRPEFNTFFITVDLDELDNHVEDNGGYDADIYLNTDDSRSIDLDVDDTFDLFPLRVWQAANGADVFEPDYHLEVIDADTEQSQTLHSFYGGKVETDGISIEKVGARGFERYRVTGLTPGLSIVKITYDAFQLNDGVGQSIVNHIADNYNSGGTYFNPIEPRNTAVVMVNVAGADSSGIQTNIDEGEDDTIYLEEGEDGVDFTFAPTSTSGDVSVRVHDPLHDSKWLDEAAWTDYGTKASGTDFTVRLKDGRNIVEVRSGEAVKYHVVYTKAVPITITNTTNPNWRQGDPVAVGDELNINIRNLKTPVQKLAGIYNPGYQRSWEGNSSNPDDNMPTVYAEYTTSLGAPIKSNRTQHGIAFGMNIPLTITEPGETTLSNGRIHCEWYGDSWGAHRNISANGKGVNTSAGYHDEDPWHSTLPDLTFYTAGSESTDTAPVTFTNLDSGASLVVKSYEGYTKTPAEGGVYSIPIGSGHKYYYSKAGCRTKAGTFSVGNSGATIALPSFTDADKIDQTTGTANVTVISKDAVLRDGAETKYDINSIPNLAAQGYVEYNTGGYTLLHALAANFGSQWSFKASKGVFTPGAALGSLENGAGWVCEVNGAVVPNDELWTTFVKDKDQIVYYYNPANAGQKAVWFEQSAASVKKGETATLTLLGRAAGTSDTAAPVAGAKVYINKQDSGLTTDAKGKVTIDTAGMTYNGHVVTVGLGEPNTLTYARAILTVTKPEDDQTQGVTFRLIGAAKHPEQEGYGDETAYQTWIQTVQYPALKAGQKVTVYNVFDWALKTAGLEYTESGSYLSRIKAPAAYGGEWLAETDNGPSSGWMFTINGVHPENGLRDVTVQNGDEIIWHYTDDFTLESGMAGATGGHLPYPSGWLAAPDTKPGDDTGAVSRDALNAAIADADKLIEADYTADSWIAFKKALADAKVVSNKATATQTEVSDALARLLFAKDSLVKKPTDSTDPGTNPEAKPHETALNGVLQYITKTVTNPVYGNEWDVFTLARAGVKDDAWNAAYLSSLGNVAAGAVVSTKDGVSKVVLAGNKYTENERVILALTALGLDASKVNLGGVTYDFVAALTDKKGDGSYAVASQGLNGVIYALIALDSKDYLQNDEGKTARAYFLKYLEDREIAGGGWALIGTIPDPDITAMALQAIATYYRLGEQGYDALSLGNIAAPDITETLGTAESPDVIGDAVPAQADALDGAEISALALPKAPAYSAIKSAAERAVTKLSALQRTQGGGFSSWGSANSESAAQILTALAALGYDGTQDGSFIKSVAEHLLTYQDVSGGFKHTLDGGVNGMATGQAAYALVAYVRYLSGAKMLYDIDTAYDWTFSYTPPTSNPGDQPNDKPGDDTAVSNTARNTDRFVSSQSGRRATLAVREAETTTSVAITTPRAESDLEEPKTPEVSVDIATNTEGGSLPVRMFIGIVAALIALALAATLIVRSRRNVT